MAAIQRQVTQKFGRLGYMRNRISAILVSLSISTNATAYLSFTADKDVNYGTTLSSEPSAGITISYWVKTDTNFSNIHVQKFSNSGNLGWLIYQTNTGDLRFGIIIGGAWKAVTYTQTLSDRFHHISGVYDGTAVRLYVDGVQVGETAATGTITPATSRPLYIGNTFDDIGDYGLDGSIDDLRIYKRALSVGEIENLYASHSRLPITDGLILWSPLDEGSDGQNTSGSGVIRDISGNALTGTPTLFPIFYSSNAINYT